MPTKSKSKHHGSTTTHAYQTMSEATDSARKNYEQAARAGQRFQEEAGQWWTRMLSQSAGDWQKQLSTFASVATDALPLAQRRMEDLMKWAEQNGRTGAELIRKAVDVAQTPVLAERQDKWMDLWSASMKAVQSNVETATEVGTRAIDSWIQFVRKNADAAETRASRMA